MAEKYWLFNSAPGDPRRYQASDFAQYFGKVLTNGLLHINSVPGLGVKTKGTDLQTYVEIGGALIDGYMYENTTDLYLSHGLPEPTLDRIDRIVLRADKRNNARYIRAFVKEGVPAAEPVPPTLQRDAFVHELSLAQVRVRANTSTLLSSDIIDERLDDELCGLVFSLIGLKSVEKIQYGQYSLMVTQQGQRAFEIPTENFDKAKDGLLVFVKGEKAPFGSYEVTFPRTVSFIEGLNEGDLIEFQVTRGVLDIPTGFAFKASDIGVDDPGKYFIADNVQEVLQEVGTDIRRLEHETANLSLFSEASQRLKNGFLFGTDFSSSFGMEIDYTRTSSQSPLAIGQTTITVDSVEGLEVGQEVTVYDDVNLERVAIQSILGSEITVIALTKNYKAGANIARSMAIGNALGKCLEFGVWGTYEKIITTNEQTGIAVLGSSGSSNPDPQSSLVRLGDAWYYAYLGSNNIQIYRRLDSEGKWVSVYTTASGVSSCSLATDGKNLLLSFCATGASPYLHVRAIRPDGTMIKSNSVNSVSYTASQISSMWREGVLYLAVKQVKTTSLDAIVSCMSMTFDAGYTATLEMGGSPFPSSFMMYSDFDTSLSMVVDANGNIGVFGHRYSKYGSTIPELVFTARIGGVWAVPKVVATGTTQKMRSCTLEVINGVFYAIYKTSLESVVYVTTTDGISFSQEIVISESGATIPLISSTSDSNGSIFLFASKGSSLSSPGDQLIYHKKSGGSFTLLATVTGRWGYAMTARSKGYILENPPFISKSPTIAYFSSTVIIGSGAPILTNDVRFTTRPTQEVVSWIERQDGCTIADATLNGYPMNLATVGNETQLVGEKPNLDIAEVRFTMTRESVGHNAKVTKIIGGNG